MLHELQQLPPYFSKEDLDVVVEARASVLEVRAAGMQVFKAV